MRIVRFFTKVYEDNDLRQQNRRRLAKDVGLYARNQLAGPLDRLLTRLYRDPSQPLVFLVGAPRSGTTLTFQLMARGLEVTYPTNAVARWFSAPVAGAWLTAPRPWERPRDIPLRSQFGGTEGPESPHEFGWFWNYHAPFDDTDDKTEAELDAVKWRRVEESLAGLAGLASRPLVLKSLNWTVYNIARFARELPQARFLHVRREPRFVVRSILACRAARYGDERLWWTIRPRDVADWLNRDPIDQVVHQVTDIRRAIDADLAKLPADRWRVVDYEDLLDNPDRFLNDMSRWLNVRALPLAGPSAGELRHGNDAAADDPRLPLIDERLRTVPCQRTSPAGSYR